ncbi:uncharacterized protein LOC126840765 [Adelges cooleyi]|uniref:uncharacterized protein LOC126840765 n=1 Tax=Adelges cooleyi TaxID=133065 RepID=UPI0021802FB6|nr:uncharacterized protein LOC126840765 [Adelges cooleyi]
MPEYTSEENKTDKEFCEIIASSITEIVRSSLNPSFRQQYFNALQVTNSTDAHEYVKSTLLALLDDENSNFSVRRQSSKIASLSKTNKQLKIERVDNEAYSEEESANGLYTYDFATTESIQ